MEVNIPIDSLESWGLKNCKPLIIAGPCSAETEEQVLETARALKAQNIEIFRAGIWKPRTRPNSFEGVGADGLQWLKTVKTETGMLTATEVANVKHVYEALKAGVDILWIGARTTVNPFAVQEIADALQGVDIPVMIKNPINPDVELWIGAMERISKAGITKIAAIHRGFSSFEKLKYRNAPQWQLAIELRRRMKNLPIICDPSHIAGQADLVFEIAQEAMDLGQDGLMIETHPNPKVALSDAKQQLTPKQLYDLRNGLILRTDSSTNPQFRHSLDELRAKIDSLDDELLAVLQRRMNVVAQIGKHKKENNIRILQANRWDEILQHTLAKGAEKGLSAEFIEKLFQAIHQEAIDLQTHILNDKQ